MAQSISIAVKVLCTIRRDEEADVFVSHCPVLSVFSQGESQEEAREAIEEAIGLHLKTAYKFDRLDQVLRRAGFKEFSGAISPEEPAQFVSVIEHGDYSQHEVNIEVPLTLLAAQSSSARCQQPLH
jgi:predicted RNase H-like HicB family nuclease